MTPAHVIARLGEMIAALQVLEAQIRQAPGPGLCVAAVLLLQMLVETLERAADEA